MLLLLYILSGGL